MFLYQKLFDKNITFNIKNKDDSTWCFERLHFYFKVQDSIKSSGQISFCNASLLKIQKKNTRILLDKCISKFSDKSKSFLKNLGIFKIWFWVFQKFS